MPPIKTSVYGKYYDTLQEQLGNAISFGLSAGESIISLTCSNLELSKDPDTCLLNEVSPIFRGTVEWEPTEFSEESDTIDNGSGLITILSKVTRQIHVFKAVMDESDLYELRRFVSEYPTIQLKTVNNGNYGLSDIVSNITVEQDEWEKNVYEVTFKFEVVKQGDGGTDRMAMGNSGCCKPLFQDTPIEDPCNPGGGGDPNCDNFNVRVQRSGNILVATVTGNTSTNYTITWMYKPVGGTFSVISQNATSVSLGGFGEYKAIAKEGNCKDEDSHVYSDPCAGFDVNLRRENGNELVAEVANGGNGLTYLWELYNTVTEAWDTLPDITPAIVATQAGQYRITATNDSGCSDQDIETVPESMLCEWTLEIVPSTLNSVDTLEAVPSDNALTYTYAWFVDRGDGLGLINLGISTQILTITSNGMYEAQVTDQNGCQKIERFVIINCNTECGNVVMLIKKIAGQLDVILNPLPDDVELLWFLNTGNGFYQIATGTSVNITLNGIYKVKARWGDGCELSKEILVYDCDSNCGNLAISIINTDCTLNASVAGGSGSETIQWYVWNGTDWVFTGATGDSYTAPNTGLYKAIVTDGSCSAEEPFFISICNDGTCEFAAGSANQYFVCN